MSNHSQDQVAPLPERPNLRHLKDQAKDILHAGQAASLADAQFFIARRYGFQSWSKLKVHVESLKEIGMLKRAIDREDLEAIKELMIRNPALHRAPLGYAKNGPLTWVAECRARSGPTTTARLDIARWMIENGSDVHQGGDGPLMRAALRGERIPMMELLLAHGADVNANWNGDFPILFAPCESLDAVSLDWLLSHGAEPNHPKPDTHETALDYLIGSYMRSSQLPACIDRLSSAGGKTRYDVPGVLDLLCDRVERLADNLWADRDLLTRRLSKLDCGTTGARRLTLKGATLLHVAAEYGRAEAARLLLAHGASPNVQASSDEAGIGGQTPIFHAVTQFADRGLAMTRLLLENGADLSIRVKLPGHYERPEEFIECTPLGYALRFPGAEFPGSNDETIALLRKQGAIE